MAASPLSRLTLRGLDLGVTVFQGFRAPMLQKPVYPHPTLAARLQALFDLRGTLASMLS